MEVYNVKSGYRLFVKIVVWVMKMIDMYLLGPFSSVKYVKPWKIKTNIFNPTNIVYIFLYKKKQFLFFTSQTNNKANFENNTYPNYYFTCKKIILSLYTTNFQKSNCIKLNKLK